MNLTLKIINGNRTSFHPVGSSPSVYRQPADADGRVAKVYDTREENMHEIFKGDEAYLINGYGKTIDIVYRPDQFGATRGSAWSDREINKLLADTMPELSASNARKLLEGGHLPVDTNDHRTATSFNEALKQADSAQHEVKTKFTDESGTFINEVLIQPRSINHAAIPPTKPFHVKGRTETPASFFHALMKRWESGER